MLRGKRNGSSPLMMEEDYEEDDWLGILICDLLYYRIYSEEKLEENMPAIIEAIGNRGRNS